MDESRIKQKCSEALTGKNKEGLRISEVLSVELSEKGDSEYEAKVDYVGEVNIDELRDSYSGELIYSKDGVSIEIKSFTGDGEICLSIEEF